ncbi:MAG: formylglycine-generating enzyme family protein [Nodosilinea sp.]
MVTTSQPQSSRDPAVGRIRVFRQRYGSGSLALAAHAAFPLTLTTDLVYCLRENFVADACPWYGAADVLLSGLCKPIGYDLYEMEAATRHSLLRYLRNQFGEARINRVADFMAAYLRYHLSNPDEPNSDSRDRRILALGEKPHWIALACLRPGEALIEIRQTLEELARKTQNPEDIFRMAGLVENIADFLGEDYQLPMYTWADNLAEQNPIDAAAEQTQSLEKVGFRVSWLDFEVATVTFGVEADDSPPQEERELKSFEFETVTVNDHGEIIAREPHTARYFEESLGKTITPLKLVAIPSGEFMMGSPKYEVKRHLEENPQHLVKVSPFFMSHTPVTQAQWRAVASLPKQEQNLEPNPAEFKGDDRPVERVSWYQAVEFCARLSELTGRTYRLPTEAEWEYACRADTTTPFYVGETLTTELANYNGRVFLREPRGRSRRATTPVGQFPPNAFGLYDLHGNVWEWCLDHWHGNYEGAPTDGTAWLTENEEARRVRRGGSWFFYPRSCRSACRESYDPANRDSYIGFRIMCEAQGL